MTKFFLPLFFVCSILQSIGAGADEELLSVELSFLGWEQVSDDLRMRMKAGDVSIRIPNTRPSGIIHYKGGNPVRFFSIQKNPEGEEIQKEVGKVYLQKEWREALLVFTEYGEIIPIRYDARAFANKELCCLNLSRRSLALMVGTEKAQLSPGKPMMLDSGDGLLPIKIAALSVSDGWRLVRSSNIHLYGAQKPLLILRDGVESNLETVGNADMNSEPEVLFRVIHTRATSR